MKLLLEVHQVGAAPSRWEGERQEAFTIGRGQVDISLEEPHCSRFHAILFVDPHGQLCVLDLDSTNGTYVNETKVDSARLDIGSSLTIGETKLTVLSFEPNDEITSAYYIEDRGTRSNTQIALPKAMGDLSGDVLNSSTGKTDKE